MKADPVERIVIIADTHGNRSAAERTLNDFAPFDTVIHCGDGVADVKSVDYQPGVELWGVHGNEDYNASFPDKLILDIYGWRILVMHGHQFEINQYMPEKALRETYEEMCGAARRENAEIFLFGHSHKPLVEMCGDVILGNPGNQYRGSAEYPTCIIAKISRTAVDLSLMEMQTKKWKELCALQRLKSV